MDGLRISNSGSSTVDGTLRATPRNPSKVACFAAATVPECHIEFPKLVPRFMPDSTMSTFSQL